MFASPRVGIQWDAGPGVGTAGWTLLSPLTSLWSSQHTIDTAYHSPVMKIGSDFLRIEFQIYIKFFFLAFEWQIVVQL